MKKYKVRAINGCGDHVAAIVEAESMSEAHKLAASLPGWPSDWDVEVSEHFITTNSIFYQRPWLLDFEEFDHECMHCDCESRY